MSVQNIKKGPFTSIVGLLLIGGSVYMAMQGDTSDVTHLLLITSLLFGGLALLGVKDPRIK